MECINNLDRVYMFLFLVWKMRKLSWGVKLICSIKAGWNSIALNTLLTYLLIYVIFSSMNCNQNDHFLVLFTSLLITFFLILFPLLQSEWKCWWKSFYTSCLPLLACHLPTTTFTSFNCPLSLSYTCTQHVYVFYGMYVFYGDESYQSLATSVLKNCIIILKGVCQ